MSRKPLAWMVIVGFAGAALGCGKYGPPVRSSYPEETVPDWVVVPPPADPAADPAAGGAPSTDSPSTSEPPTGEPPPAREAPPLEAAP